MFISDITCSTVRSCFISVLTVINFSTNSTIKPSLIPLLALLALILTLRYAFNAVDNCRVTDQAIIMLTRNSTHMTLVSYLSTELPLRTNNCITGTFFLQALIDSTPLYANIINQIVIQNTICAFETSGFTRTAVKRFITLTPLDFLRTFAILTQSTLILNRYSRKSAHCIIIFTLISAMTLSFMLNKRMTFVKKTKLSFSAIKICFTHVQVSL